MIYNQNRKTVMLLKPQSIATDATATGNVDTYGYRYCTVDILVDSASAVSANAAVCKLAEADDTNTTSFANITEFVGDTAWTIPNASTDTPQVYQWNVDLRGRKRYLRISYTSGGAAQLVAAVASLTRAEELPNSTTEAGAAAIVTA